MAYNDVVWNQVFNATDLNGVAHNSQKISTSAILQNNAYQFGIWNLRLNFSTAPSGSVTIVQLFETRTNNVFSIGSDSVRARTVGVVHTPVAQTAAQEIIIEIPGNLVNLDFLVQIQNDSNQPFGNDCGLWIGRYGVV